MTPPSPITAEIQPTRRRIRLGEAIAARVRRLSRANAGTDLRLLDWGKRYLPRYFQLPPSKMHRWMGAQLDEMADQRGAKVNVLGPRGSAKSTMATLCLALRSVVEAREPYVWIVSDTKSQAQTHLDNLRSELEDNRLLAADYPNAVGRGPRWRATMLELSNGCLVESFGAGQRIRGRRRREHRPTLIVCDDLQSDAHATSRWQREASARWFHGALLKAGNQRTNVVNLATALHRSALAMQLHQTPGWTSRIFQSIGRWPLRMELWQQWEHIYCDADNPRAQADALEFFQRREADMSAGAEVLWAETEDLYALMKMRAEAGHAAFDREKQNSPVDPELCEWPEEYFGDPIWFDDWPADLAIKTLALDPSKGGDARRGDYSAFVLLGIDREGRLYVDADLARRPTPQIVADGVALCAATRPDVLGVEANQFQELLAAEFVAEFQRQGRQVIQPVAIHNHVHKAMRIRRLGPYLAQRRIRFRSDSASARLLVEQLREFPSGAHDDGPDALEMALRLAEDWFHAGRVDDGLGDRLPVDR